MGYYLFIYYCQFYALSSTPKGQELYENFENIMELCMDTVHVLKPGLCTRWESSSQSTICAATMQS